MENTHNARAGPEFCSGVLDSKTIEYLTKNPRAHFRQAIKKQDAATCLIKTAELHGHFCPGSALGVMATLFGLDLLGDDQASADGIMENLIAIVEVNACFADGVQAVSGCTLGNNSLIYRDLGKHAVTFAIRGRKEGIRVRLLPGFKDSINKLVPEFYPLMKTVIMKRSGTMEDEQKFRVIATKTAFSVITLPYETLFATQTVTPILPERAPITDSSICPGCGEEVMSTKIHKRGLMKNTCFMCNGKYFEVEGRGIVKRDLYTHSGSGA